LLYGFALTDKRADDRYDIFYIIVTLILIRNIDTPVFFILVIISKAIITSFHFEGSNESSYNYIKNAITQLVLLIVAFLGSIYLGASNNIFIIPILLGLYFYLRTEGLRVYSKKLDLDSLSITKNVLNTVIIPSLVLYKLFSVENALSFLVLDGASNVFFVFFIGMTLYLLFRQGIVNITVYSSLLVAYLYLSAVVSFELMIAINFLSFFTIFLTSKMYNVKTKYILKSIFMLTPLSPLFYIVIIKLKNANLDVLELIGIAFMFVVLFLNVMNKDHVSVDMSNKNKLVKSFACFLSLLVVLYIYDTV
jgi:hypothetical protein